MRDLRSQEDSDSHGGGVYCNNSNPTISGCTISNNTATYSGGGIYCTGSGSNPSISDCTISNNTATSDGDYGYGGGGIYCTGSSTPTITGCTITGNTADNLGGGIYCTGTGSNPSISDCTISNNTASFYGGGIYCYDSSSPTITGCEISNNTTNYSGGGITCSSSDPSLYRLHDLGQHRPLGRRGNLLRLPLRTHDHRLHDHKQHCQQRRRDLLLRQQQPRDQRRHDFEQLRLRQYLWRQRRRDLLLRLQQPPLIGCVIAGNTATNDGGGIYCSVGSNPTISSCTVCGNTPDQTSGDWTDNGGNSIDTECCPDPTNDGVVSSDDVQSIMNAWNCMTCDSDDVNFDGVVDVRDLLEALAAWGPCE